MLKNRAPRSKSPSNRLNRPVKTNDNRYYLLKALPNFPQKVYLIAKFSSIHKPYKDKENKLVHVWTIDNKEEMFKLIDFGVDGIMTDKPSILKQAMTERGFSDLGNSP